MDVEALSVLLSHGETVGRMVNVDIIFSKMREKRGFDVKCGNGGMMRNLFQIHVQTPHSDLLGLAQHRIKRFELARG